VQPGEMIWFLVGIGAGLVLAMLGFALMALLDSRRLLREAGPRPNRAEDHARRVSLPPLNPIPDVPPEPVPVMRRHAGAARLKRREEAEGSLDHMMSSLAAELERMQSSETAQVAMELPDTKAPMVAVAAPVQVAVAPPVHGDRPADRSGAEPTPRATDAPLTPMRAAMTKAMESRRPSPRELPTIHLPVAPSPADTPRVADTLRAAVVESNGPVGAGAEPTEHFVGPTVAPIVSPVMTADATTESADATDDRDSQVAEAKVVPVKPKIPPLPRVAPARKFAPALPPRQPPAGSKPD